MSGSLLWNRTWRLSNYDVWGYSIAVDSSGVYVAGILSGANDDAFVLKYDLNGNELWNKTWGGAMTDTAWSIAVMGSNIYVGGYTDTYDTGGLNDTVIVKYDLNGNEIWNKTWGGYGNEGAFSIAVTSSNIYATGTTNSSGAGMYDAYVLKCNLDGGGGVGNQPPTAIIDSISPAPAMQGQTITFTGHGADSDGTIVAYNWR